MLSRYIWIIRVSNLHCVLYLKSRFKQHARAKIVYMNVSIPFLISEYIYKYINKNHGGLSDAKRAGRVRLPHDRWEHHDDSFRGSMVGGAYLPSTA